MSILNYLAPAIFLIGVVSLTLGRIRRKPTFEAIQNDDRASGRRRRTPKPLLPTSMQVLVSIAVLGASLFVILSQRFGPQDAHWAYASAGTILGYWLKK
jgi:hypothetical protein